MGKKVGAWTIHFILYILAFVRGDEATMRREVERAKTQPHLPVVLLLQGQSECAQGRIKRAADSYAPAVRQPKIHNYMEFAAIVMADDATCDSELGLVK